MYFGYVRIFILIFTSPGHLCMTDLLSLKEPTSTRFSRAFNSLFFQQASTVMSLVWLATLRCRLSRNLRVQSLIDSWRLLKGAATWRREYITYNCVQNPYISTMCRHVPPFMKGVVRGTTLGYAVWKGLQSWNTSSIRVRMDFLS